MPERWEQRFFHFEKAYLKLQELENDDIKQLSELERQGYIQRFEMTFELAWKVTKDFLEFMKVDLGLITPKTIIKSAFSANMIKEGQIWIDMLEERNALSHTYDENRFLEAVVKIQKTYIATLGELYAFLKKQQPK